MKFIVIIFSFFAFTQALKCQSCSGEDYQCNGENDNGESVECPVWANSCQYYYDDYYNGTSSGAKMRLWTSILPFFFFGYRPWNSQMFNG